MAILPCNRRLNMPKLVIQLDYTKSTKGTHVYGSEEDDAPVRTLYIKRSALPVMEPKRIAVELAWEEEG